MNPYRTREVFSLYEQFVIRPEVQSTPPNDTKVEYLVASSAQIKRTRLASLWESKNIQKSATNIKKAADSEHSYVDGDFVIIHET